MPTFPRLNHAQDNPCALYCLALVPSGGHSTTTSAPPWIVTTKYGEREANLTASFSLVDKVPNKGWFVANMVITKIYTTEEEPRSVEARVSTSRKSRISTYHQLFVALTCISTHCKVVTAQVSRHVHSKEVPKVATEVCSP
ncbi:hypothetical protein BGZ63DRAFT_408051 [Mariannaea sp. PMI_226]|nr:hypothetical protein BGZ63DRAFT_408051 [Mariannaea sp. PMI_226]